MASGGDEDPVISEVDVYLSKSLADSLYLFQYPVRPLKMPYDDVNHLQARVKPKQQKVELELSINTRSPNYDRSKGEQIVKNVDGQEFGSNSYFKSSLMDKQVLSSAKAITNTARYVAGVLHQGELHVTPLHSVVQLRPSFSYLDRSDSRSKSDDGAGGTSFDAEGLQEEDDEEAKAIKVRFAGPESEKAKKAREQSYNYLQQQVASEPWINVDFHPVMSDWSQMQKRHLICSRTEQDLTFNSGTAKEYLENLVPSQGLSASSAFDSDKRNQSMKQIRSMALPDQVRSIMISAKVIYFQQLMQLLAPNLDPAVVLRVLQQVALLVQGCWVVKSELLYPKDSRSQLTGVSADVLVRARDYIMWLYTHSNYLKIQDLVSIIKIPQDDIKDILEGMAQCCPPSGWKFVLEADNTFMNYCPEVARRQKMLWEAKCPQLTRSLHIGQDQNAVMPGSRTTKSPGTPRQRRRTKSQRESTSDDTEGSGTELCNQYEKAETDGMKARKKAVPTLRVNNGPVQKMDIGSPPPVKNGPSSHTHPRMATFDIDQTTLDFSPSPEQWEELLKFSREKLQTRFCLTLNELRRLLMLKLSESPPGHLLRTGVSDIMLEQSLVEVGGQKLQNKWPQHTQPEPLFALTRTGDHLDRFRDALIDAFSKQARIRIGTLQKKVEDELGESLSESDCKTLLRDYCLNKSGFYYLKGTVSPDS